MIQRANSDYKIPELEEVHRRELKELFINQDARSANYLDKIFLVYSYRCLQTTFNLTDIEKTIVYYSCNEHLMYQEIIDKMGISYDELYDHHKSILTKMGLNKMMSVDMTMIHITYLIKSYIQSALLKLVTNSA